MTRRASVVTGTALILAAVLLGMLVALVPAAHALDTWWNATMMAVREEWMVNAALVFDNVGGGVIAGLIVPLGLAGALLLFRRWRDALFASICFAASAVAVQVLKHLFGRARPEEMLVVSDFGSFPSGHTANAATIALVLWLIVPRVWVGVLGVLLTVLMALSRTILSVHWLTDTIGGTLVGAGTALLVAAALWGWLRWGVRPDREEKAVPQIRPYRPSDRDALYDVCVKTADAGADATGILSDDRLWGDVWAVPYAERHPDLCWVVESDDARVIGYIVATDDTASFETWFREEWWPGRVGAYPAPPVPGHPRQNRVMSYAEGRGLVEEPNAVEYPAHLHIDLLPETQGMGLGRRLTELLFAELAARGVAGLHLSMNSENTAAGAFYERLGMHVLPSGEGARDYGVRF